jgi:Fe-S oxidoreductase
VRQAVKRRKKVIDEKKVENIMRYGVCHDSGAGRAKVLFEGLGLMKDQKAEYIILSGCFPPERMPQAFRALKNFLDHFEVSYSFLSKEYCCGWMPLGQPAVMAKNEAEIARSKELSQGFVQENFKQAEALGAKSIVLFCAACEPTYSNCRGCTNLEVISFSQLLDRFFPGGRLPLDADYYAGCYRFRRRITQTALDVEPALRVLKKIEGLKVNCLDHNLCCYVPPHLEKLIDSLKTKTIITICTGCYNNLQQTLRNRGEYRVKMLPEVVWESVRHKD